MKKILLALTCAAIALSLASCSGNRQAVNADTMDTVSVPEYDVMPYGGPDLVVGGSSRAMPRAVIYKTNGDYNDNVAVTMNASRTAIMSYPAPTDVSASSSALPVADGWLLDRRGGIGTNTAFLRWTYAQYAAMKTSPSVSQIMEQIIPDARVVSVKTLDISASQALRDPALVDSIISRSAAPAPKMPR